VEGDVSKVWRRANDGFVWLNFQAVKLKLHTLRELALFDIRFFCLLLFNKVVLNGQ
jgi:hypothetical protein